MQEDSPRRSTEDRSRAMRTRLIRAARALFVAKGYAATGTPDIVAAAQATRGALYHHFADKADLFRAVVKEEAEAVAMAIKAASVGQEAPLLKGAEAYFEAMKAPRRARLLLIEGPAVLGLDGMAAIDIAAGGETLREGLAHSLPGRSEAEIAALAEMVSAGFDRAALAIAGGAATAPYLAAFRAMLSAFERGGKRPSSVDPAGAGV
jgi:AcrR family transcriptional regulator